MMLITKTDQGIAHLRYTYDQKQDYPDSKVHGANMGPIWDRQDPGGPHVGPMILAIWVGTDFASCIDHRHLTNNVTLTHWDRVTHICVI